MCWFRLNISHVTWKKNNGFSDEEHKPHLAFVSFESIHNSNWNIFAFIIAIYHSLFHILCLLWSATISHMWIISFHHEFLINRLHHAMVQLNRLTDKLPFLLWAEKPAHTIARAHSAKRAQPIKRRQKARICRLKAWRRQGIHGIPLFTVGIPHTLSQK